MPSHCLPTLEPAGAFDCTAGHRNCKYRVPDRNPRLVSHLKGVHELGVLHVGLILPLLQEVVGPGDRFVLGELSRLAFVEVYHILGKVSMLIHVSIHACVRKSTQQAERGQMTHETVYKEQDQRDRPAYHHRSYACGIFRSVRRLESLWGDLLTASVSGRPLTTTAL